MKAYGNENVVFGVVTSPDLARLSSFENGKVPKVVGMKKGSVLYTATHINAYRLVGEPSSSLWILKRRFDLMTDLRVSLRAITNHHSNKHSVKKHRETKSTTTDPQMPSAACGMLH